MEDAHVACAHLLMKAQEMMGQNGLSWKYIIISERKPLLYDDEAAVPFLYGDTVFVSDQQLIIYG